jgi:ABC-type uncharacterized transport system auxiliary subunit
MKIWMLVLLTSCALTRKSKPVTVHYYAPPVPSDTRSVGTSAPDAEVRLGRISASNYLGYAIAYRISPVELRLYDLDRWTDTPDEYAKHALERALFGSGRITQATTGRVLTVDMEVTAFEEVRSPAIGGRVQIRFEVHDERNVVATDIVTVERKARSAQLADIVSAIGTALDEATAEVAERIVTVAVAHPVHPGSRDDVSGHRVSGRR